MVPKNKGSMVVKPSTSRHPSPLSEGGVGGATAADGANTVVGTTDTGSAVAKPAATGAGGGDVGGGCLPQRSGENDVHGTGDVGALPLPPPCARKHSHQSNPTRLGMNRDPPAAAAPTTAMGATSKHTPHSSQDERDVTPSGVVVPPQQHRHGKSPVDQTQDPRAPLPPCQLVVALTAW